MSQKLPKISFNAGELTPHMRSRIRLQKYQQGCNLLNNFLVLPQGPIIRRSGTVFTSKLTDAVVPYA